MFLVTMSTRVLTVGMYSAFCVVKSAFSNLPFFANTSGNLYLMMFTRVLTVSVYSAFCFVMSAFSNLPFLANTL